MCFKRCTGCGFPWETRERFLSDPLVHLNGYQVNFKALEAGFFLFTHRIGSCGSTMALEAKHFLDLHAGPVFERSLRGSPECRKLCERGTLDACSNVCECRFVRDVLQTVRNWPKADPSVRSARTE